MAAFPRARYERAGIPADLISDAEASFGLLTLPEQDARTAHIDSITDLRLYAETLLAAVTEAEVLEWVGQIDNRARAAFYAERDGAARQSLLDTLADRADMDPPGTPLPSPFVRAGEKGAPEGVATLNAEGKVEQELATPPATNDPDAVHAADYTAKGDLLAGTAAGEVSAQAVGADGEYLVADSASPTGLSWAAGTSGTPADYDDVKDRLTAAEGSITTLQGDVSSVSAQITSDVQAEVTSQLDARDLRGEQGVSSPQSVSWGQVGELAVEVGEPWFPPVDVELLAVNWHSSEQIGDTPPAFNLRLGGVDHFPAGARTIPTGQYHETYEWASPLSVAKNTQVRPVVESKGGAAGGADTIVVRGDVAEYESPVDAFADRFTIPVPSDRQAGDTLLAFVSAGNDVATVPAGWTELAGTVNTGGTLHTSVLRRVATGNADDADDELVFAAGTNIACSVIAVGGADTNLFEQSATAAGDSQTDTFTGPSPGSVDAGKLVVRFTAARYGAGTSGLVSHDGGVDYTEVSDHATNRTGANSNYGVTLLTRIMAATANVPALTYTADTPAFRWYGYDVVLTPAAASNSPGANLTVTVHYRQAAA